MNPGLNARGSLYYSMKNKVLILLMSCNQPLYDEEEQACRDTFLKDAEEAGVSYYFYKGLDGTHSASCIDEEAHTIYIDVSDGLGGTAKKTALALEMTGDKDYDYVLKTNVSTYLNINNIAKAVDEWEGAEDDNIYGGRFIINQASKNIPFPRGYFTLVSKKLVSGALPFMKKLAWVSQMPKTDDTLLGLSLLYYIKKGLEKDYMGSLNIVPSVISWRDDIWENPGLLNALAVRCKNENALEKTPDNMRAVDRVVKEKTEPKKYRMPAEQFETPYGLMSYNNHLKIDKIITELNKMAEKENAQK